MDTSKPPKSPTSALASLALLPVFAAGAWAFWQSYLIGTIAGYSASSAQPIALAFKGSIRYVSADQAHTYELSQDLVLFALVYAAAVGVFSTYRRHARVPGREA